MSNITEILNIKRDYLNEVVEKMEAELASIKLEPAVAILLPLLKNLTKDVANASFDAGVEAADKVTKGC